MSAAEAIRWQMVDIRQLRRHLEAIGRICLYAARADASETIACRRILLADLLRLLEER